MAQQGMFEGLRGEDGGGGGGIKREGEGKGVEFNYTRGCGSKIF